MSQIRGVVLAGGKGTRLGELTKVTNKHLLPVGPIPMVYHPLHKMVGAGLKDILLVSGTEHMGDFVELLGSGKDHKCSLTYRVQDEAGGIAQALGLAETFCAGNRCLVILGDNIFEAPVTGLVSQAGKKPDWAWIGLKQVHDPGRYGVAELKGDRVIGIEEKPKNPKSDYAVIGIYIYPSDVFEVIRTLKPSGRGELEITDVNNHYLKAGRLGYSIIDGYWTDAGTLDSLQFANQLVREKPPIF
ncbi:NTP transferase domain-containing protein [Telmatocola sphagniphila]|uniref:glucose-1-phosphate thymidylyltransferase n=1 Tax=Telmatocola sphagniphila TaxID=1123043 RepID=A0A8E6EVR1_9BACT|nr:sugar phosphate nucleotidyltransferase [Telmatocola sphagniphila]QVL33100.1 NTP transferase domain-containing protein [Telmatocola sphagniphila]